MGPGMPSGLPGSFPPAVGFEVALRSRALGKPDRAYDVLVAGQPKAQALKREYGAACRRSADEINLMDLISGSVDQTSSPQAKITLFRSLFRGRDDVHPRRFESRKTGKSGYAPACANEWVRGVCEKPRIKCAECPNRRFLPVTDDIIRWHLSGCDAEGQPFVAGVYPLLRDETCYFLAVDFDKAGWRDDASAFLELSPPQSPSRVRTIALRARCACLVLLQ